MRQIGTNEPTRYELVATDGERTILVGYTPRKNLRGVIDMLTSSVDSVSAYRLDLLAKKTETTPGSWEVVGRRSTVVSGKWVVKFSGRTQRDCRSLGECTESIYQTGA